MIRWLAPTNSIRTLCWPAGNPAMSIPFGFDAKGLPLAFQVIGRPGDEATLLSLAGSIEREKGGWPQPTT